MFFDVVCVDSCYFSRQVVLQVEKKSIQFGEFGMDVKTAFSLVVKQGRRLRPSASHLLASDIQCTRLLHIKRLWEKMALLNHPSIHKHGIPINVNHGTGALIQLIIVRIHLKCPLIAVSVNLGVRLVVHKITGNRADAIAFDGIEPDPIFSKTDK